jgi:hypothetical protein
MEKNKDQASSSIRVVKFSSGEEVVSVVIDNDTEVVLSNPAKIVIYTTTNEEGHVIECLRLTSYLANIKEKAITVLKDYIMYMSEPSEDILKMYDAYLSFMEGQTGGIVTAELEEDGDALDIAWTLFSDTHFVNFLQELYEDSHIDFEEIEEEDLIEEEEINKLWEKETEAEKKPKKKRKFKKEELKMPYTPDGDIKDPKSWSDNPEDYLK